MNRGYLNPRAEGYLLEAKGCDKVCKELRRVADKLQRAVDRERAARQKEFETVMQYASEEELHEDYGWDVITELQYNRYLDMFREGQAALENTPPTVTEVALKIVRRILTDIDLESREWRFDALTPAEQQAELDRAAASQKAWKAKIAEIKRRRGFVEADQQADAEGPPWE